MARQTGGQTPLVESAKQGSIETANRARADIASTNQAPSHHPGIHHEPRQKLAEAGGIAAFGVNLTRLPPGEWSSQRHWHSHEDEFVFVLERELVLIEDGGETTLQAGDAAAFPGGSGDGHHMINRSRHEAVYLEIGSRHPDDVITCSDVDMMSTNADGRFLHKDGTPFPNG